MPERIPLAVRLTSERNMRINERFAARARIDGRTPDGRYDRVVSDYAERQPRTTGSDAGRSKPPERR